MMANILDHNPICIDTFAAGDIVISDEPMSLKLAQLFTAGAVGNLRLIDKEGNTLFNLATVASNTTDHLEFHTHLQTDSLRIASGHSVPAGSYLIIQI
jgi:hypothetical protein